MKISQIAHLKSFINDELKQSKPMHKRVKKTTLYKNNEPIKRSNK